MLEFTSFRTTSYLEKVVKKLGMFLFSADAFSTEKDDINQKDFIPFGIKTITNFPVISK